MQYEDIVLADGPVGYWPCTETSGSTAYDYSGNGRNGTYLAGGDPAIAKHGSPSGLHRAPQFATGNVDIADNSAFSAGAGASGIFTAEAWAYLASLPGAYECVLGKAAGGNNFEWTLGVLSGGKFFFQCETNTGGANNLVDSGTIPATQRWYHLVGEWDKAGGFMALYVNARLVSTTTPSITMTDGTGPLHIGQRGDGSGSFAGSACHAAYYNKLLPASRIAAHYQAGRLMRTRRGAA